MGIVGGLSCALLVGPGQVEDLEHVGAFRLPQCVGFERANRDKLINGEIHSSV